MNRLLEHLQGLAQFSGVDTWTEDRIRPGDEWQVEIDAGLAVADVALLLLSPSFLASKFINDDEVPKLLMRHANGGVRIIPVLLKACTWESHPVLGKFQMLPPGAVPLASFTGERRNSALVEVAREIARLAKERGGSASAAPPSSAAGVIRSGARQPTTTGPDEWTVGRISATVAHGPQSITVSRLELCVEREAGQPAQRSVVLDGEFFRIGSHPVNNLVLTDPLVSRFHCSLTRSNMGFRVTDSGSLNGTRVTGVRVRDADLPLPECRLELGESVVRVRDLGAASQDVVSSRLSLGSLFGVSMAMRRLFELVKRVAHSNADVLIEGESGTGKQLIATEIMRLGGRAEKPLVIVDCGIVSTQFIESELFGHMRGSFEGATDDRAGAFEAAEGGTVFLDEIGELPIDMQPRLLRMLAAREVRRIGENRVRKVDVRVISTTKRQLEREVNSGRFREDLYYRLSVLTVRVPPLRERLDDLQILVRRFLEERDALDKVSLFTPEVLAEMMRHEWPGNVRELRSYVERRMALEPRPPAPPSSAHPPEPLINADLPMSDAIADFERAYLTDLLRWADGDVGKAARKAKLDRMDLYRLFQRYGLRIG
jgi:DNA-binding NtrC family response regulator